MGLYNTLHGHHEGAGLLLAGLGLSPASVGRFRDAWVTGDGQIAIYTRMGGGNREDYAEEITQLQAHPLYLRDEDDDFDCTYATFYFSPPDSIPDDFPREPRNGDEIWADTLGALEKAPRE